MEKIKSRIITLTVISVCFVFFTSICIAIDVNFDSPTEVELNEEFEIKTLFQNSISYDIKIFVHNSSDNKITRGEIISLTSNGDKWQDSWNYLLSPPTKGRIYRLKIVEYSEKANICLRLRKTGTSNYEEACKSIEIIKPTSNSVIQENFSLEAPIRLNNIEKKQFTDTESKIRLYMVSAFFIITVIILILFVLRKI